MSLYDSLSLFLSQGSLAPGLVAFANEKPPAIGQGGAADGKEGTGVKGGGGGTGGLLGRAVNTVMKPSHSRLGRSAVYIRYLGYKGGALGDGSRTRRFVDTVFSLQVPK
jgi:hypothetical protein